MPPTLSSSSVDFRFFGFAFEGDFDRAGVLFDVSLDIVLRTGRLRNENGLAAYS